MTYLAPIVSALVSAISLAIMLSSRFGSRIQDIPNERSLHSAPTPRIGGIGLIAGMLSGWAILAHALTWWLLLPLFLLLWVSLLDDMRGLPVRLRLSAQLLAAALLVAGLGLIGQGGIVTIALVLLLTVWMTNLYNFMDGSDGLAGGMAVFGFAAYGVAALLAHDETFAMLNFSVAAAALGFLLHNYPPAKVFMGDAGSIPLGFLVAAFGLWGWMSGHWQAWFPLLVFSPFIVDASVTLAKRSLRGVKITAAHRDHYYQRAVRMGWSHRNVALAEYALMAGCGVSALLLRDSAFPWQALLLWGCIYGALMLPLDAAWKRGQHA